MAELPAADAAIRRRPRKKAPVESTGKLLHFLESYLQGKPNRTFAAMSLLGCSESTAKRLTNRSTPYTKAMKMAWVYNICAAVGKPVSSVLPSASGLSCAQAIVGWSGLRPGAEAIQAAYNCAQAISLWAFESYGLSGDTLVSHRDGIPTIVNIALSPYPAMALRGGKYACYHLIITNNRFPNGKSQMWLKSTEPGDRIIHSGRLSHYSLRMQLIDIYDRTKNIARELARESAQCAAS